MTTIIQLENIPQELRDRPQWVTWKYANGTKLPCSITTGKVADAHDPASWGTFDQAVEAYQRRHHAGIGFDITEGDPYTGIDFDDCIADDGTMDPLAAALIGAMNTYSEISPSTKGVKAWVRGSVPQNITPTPLGNGVKIEIYSARRFFTVTGHQLEGTPATIREVDEDLQNLYDAVRPAPAETAQPRPIAKATTDSGHARRYALAALEGEHQKVRTADDGMRHWQRWKSAKALGGFVPHITEQEIFDACAVNFGKNQKSAESTIRAGIAAGIAAPRTIPEPRETYQQIDCRSNDDLENLNPEALRQRLREVIAERDRYKQQAEHLDQWRTWALQTAAIPTERLSPAAKVVAMSLWPEMKSRESRGVDSSQPIYIGDPNNPDDDGAARRAGLSSGTFGAKLKELAAVGAIVHEVGRDPITKHKKVMIKPAAFDQPATWIPDEERNHGGARPGAGRPFPTCDTCPPETPVLETIVTTAEYACACGTPLSQHERRRAQRWHKPNNQDGAWEAGPLSCCGGHDTNPQLEVTSKDRCLTPIRQVEGRSIPQHIDQYVDKWSPREDRPQYTGTPLERLNAAQAKAVAP